MKTVVIQEGFQAYPNGKLREFAAGEEVEVSDEFGGLIVEKGHAREKSVKAPAGDKGEKESRT